MDIAYYSTLDEPIPFKELECYFVKVKDYFVYNYCKEILEIDKNEIPDMEIIQMNYLDFIIKKLFSPNFKLDDKNEHKDWIVRFYQLLQMVFHVEYDSIDIGINAQNRAVLSIDGIHISGTEFDELRILILTQNTTNYIDYFDMSADFKREFIKYHKVKNKNLIIPNLHKKIIALISLTACSKKDILEMSIFDFETLFEITINKSDYSWSKIAESNGAKFKKPIEHWLYKNKKGEFDDAFSSVESVKNNII